MTWNEVSPGIHEATGAVLYMRLERVDPFDPYYWNVSCRAGLFTAQEEMAGPLAEVQVKALRIVGEFASRLLRDAEAEIVSARHASELVGVSYR